MKTLERFLAQAAQCHLTKKKNQTSLSNFGWVKNFLDRICRLLMSFLYGYLLKNEDQQTCTRYQAVLMAKHILIECTQLAR